MTNDEINSGKKANISGKELEDFVADCLKNRGYKEIFEPHEKKILFQNRNKLTEKLFARQVCCGLSIYEAKRKCDFLVVNNNKFNQGLIIECKNQNSNGSVDEKYPFLLACLKKTDIKTMLLIEGHGYKMGIPK